MTSIIKRYQIEAKVTGILFFFALFALIQYPVKDIRAASLTDNTQKYRLDNGLNVILKEDHSSPVVAVQVWVKTGSANESEDEAGITHVIEHMIFKGTPTRKTGEIARDIESAGGEVNAYTTYDRTVYFIEIVSSQLDKALEILLDAIQNSLFDPQELEKEKEVILEEYRRSLDSPDRQLVRAMHELAFKKHTYKRPVIGYESTIRSINRKGILRYIDKWYAPENMTLVVVGDLDPYSTINKIRSLVKDFPERHLQKPSRSVEPRQTAIRNNIIKDNVHQAYMGLAWHIPSSTHPDIPALDILEVILSYGKSSRLNNRLRMETNLVRSVYAGSAATLDPGLFSIICTLDPGNINDVLKTITNELNRLSSEPVLKSELSKAEKIVESDYLSVMETMSGQAQTLGSFEIMNGDMYEADEYLKKLDSVTGDDIIRVSRLYFTPENLSIVLMIPENSAIAPSGDKITGILSQTRLKDEGKSNTSMKHQGEKVGKYALPNGMRIIVKENHRLPLVSIRIAMLGGLRLENPEQAGISEFTSRMLTRGTDKLSASDISSTIDAWGADLEGFSGRNSIGLSAKFLKRDLDSGLELIADIIRNTSFPEIEIDKVREDMLTDIRAKKDNPIRELTELFNRTLYQHHPYGRSTGGTEKSISSIQRPDLITWYRFLLTPSNIVIALTGDTSKDEVLSKLSNLFGDMDSSAFTPPDIQPEPPLRANREVHLERPGEQVHIMIGYLGADLRSYDNAVMTLIDTALSGQGGRLFYRLRDKQSLAYSISSFRRPGLETGMFGVYLACAPEKVETAKKALFHELGEIREKGLSSQELEDAKRYVLGNLAIEYQTDGSQAMRMALDELYGMGYDHHEVFIAEIKRVTLEDIRSAAKKIINPDRYVLATVGPVK